MTHTEEASTAFASKTSTEQMNGHSMASTENREAEEQGSSRTSPSEGRRADATSGSSVLEMGSTDSAGSAHSGGPSCGLVSSLFPSSCRGRAEAFARRLHRRLTSLGGEDGPRRDDDASKPEETSWLRSATVVKAAIGDTAAANRVLRHQPRHDPDTELCYDFDLEFEDGLGSPAEEATAAEVADLLVNHREVLKTAHRGVGQDSPNGARDALSSGTDRESSYAYASPLMGTPPDSDSSDAYFDPESSSDVERPRNEAYFDPIAASDSETTVSNLSNGRDPADRRKPGIDAERSEDASESSGSFVGRNDVESRGDEPIVRGSDDSASSRETTSPSHESLWSTFDESTVSLRDESPSGIGPRPMALALRVGLPKSHSDSEIPAARGPRIVVCSPTTGRDGAAAGRGTDQVDFVNGPSRRDELDGVEDARNPAREDAPEPSSDSATEEELPYDEDRPRDPTVARQTNARPSLKPEEIEIETEDHSTYSSTFDIPGALALECPTGERVAAEATLKNEVRLRIENGSVTTNSDEDKMCLLLRKLATSPSVKGGASLPGKAARDAVGERPDVPEQDEDEEDEVEEEEDEEEEEEEEERPQKIRRCSSLKTGKTPPGTPGRKKIVRFADVLGLDLADVRTFLDEIPKIPNSAYSDLIYDDIFQKDPSPVNGVPSAAVQWGGGRYPDSGRRNSGCPTAPRKLDRTLLPLFQQPAGLPNFLDLVRERRVCLENVLVQDPVSLCVQGTVRVINLDFHKSVHVRYTLNSWRNFSDLQATYVSNSCDGFSDKFSFVLYCHTLPVGQRLEFAVRFQCKGEQYWDNNAGANYCFQCLPASPAVGYIPITASTSQPHDWSPMFY